MGPKWDLKAKCLSFTGCYNKSLPDPDGSVEKDISRTVVKTDLRTAVLQVQSMFETNSDLEVLSPE